MSAGKAILKQWKLDLSKRDRTVKSVEQNFAELVSDMNLAGLEYEEAKDLMEDAIEMHYPNPAVVKRTYSSQQSFKDISLKEFADQWRDMISTKGWCTFHEVYPDPELPSKQMIGGMTPQEYAAQERIANMFQTIDPQEAAKQIEEYVKRLEERVKEEFGIDMENYDG